jgi:dihydrofolate reductase
MRKLKLQVQLSIDGFIAGPNGEMDWLTFNWDDELKQYVTELTESVDCIVLGRKLAQGFIPHWAARPDYEDPKGIDKINDTPKVVFTKTWETNEWPNTTLAKGDLTEEITALKNQPGQDMIVYGGGSFVASLLKAGLIDELNLLVNPVALGAGMPIFSSLESPQKYVLETSKGFSCGITLLKYRKAA